MDYYGVAVKYGASDDCLEMDYSIMSSPNWGSFLGICDSYSYYCGERVLIGAIYGLFDY